MIAKIETEGRFVVTIGDHKFENMVKTGEWEGFAKYESQIEIGSIIVIDNENVFIQLLTSAPKQGEIVMATGNMLKAIKLEQEKEKAAKDAGL